MIKFIVEAKQLAALLNYLASRPWAEVNNLIAEFSKLEKLEENLGAKEASESTPK